MKIGLLFGSFNPIHIGHVAIANYMAESKNFDQVWLMVSPHNPLKEKKALADIKKRLASVKKAIGRNRKIKVSNVELRLPLPSYTIDTLHFLKKKYPKDKFALIIGSDNLNSFHKWKDYKTILNSYKVYVYPRSGSGGVRLKNHRNVKIVDAPKINISSTYIRTHKKKDVRDLLP